VRTLPPSTITLLSPNGISVYSTKLSPCKSAEGIFQRAKINFLCHLITKHCRYTAPLALVHEEVVTSLRSKILETRRRGRWASRFHSSPRLSVLWQANAPIEVARLAQCIRCPLARFTNSEQSAADCTSEEALART